MKIVTPRNDSEISKIFKTENNIIIDFYATWCSPCDNIDRAYQEIKKDDLFKDLTLVRVDIEKFQEMSRSYGVKSLPTSVYTVDESGERKTLKTKVGSMSKADLIKLIGEVYEG
tara:strand:+ start:953 stop:1294 length:342 start_codon:yes stop_codon:yes gene_type:complete